MEQKYKEALSKMPVQGFLKITAQKKEDLSKEQRSVLIRRGNELFNKKNIDLAKRIFLTTGYTDGLIRIGEYYLKTGKPLEALRMFWMAPHKKKVDAMIEKMAFIIHKFLDEEGKNDQRK